MRMNRVTVVVVMVVALTLVGLAGAGANNALRAQPTAVAVADIQAIFNTLKEKTALEAELQSRAEELDRQIRERRQEIEALKQDLGVLAPESEGYNQKQEELEMKAIQLQAWMRFSQEKLQREQGLQTESLYRKILDTIARVAEENGYDLVLFKEQAPNFDYDSTQQLSALIQMRKVLYASDAVDITDQVSQRMNNEWESGG